MLDLRFEPRDAPRISCIMATRGDVHPARHAIACFHAQTHAARELVRASRRVLDGRRD